MRGCEIITGYQHCDMIGYYALTATEQIHSKQSTSPNAGIWDWPASLPDITTLLWSALCISYCMSTSATCANIWHVAQVLMQ